MKRLTLVALLITATQLTGCIGMAEFVAENAMAPASNVSQAEYNVLANARVQTTPPNIRAFESAKNGDPYAQFLYQAMSNWQNTFRGLGGSAKTPQEQAAWLTETEAGKDLFIRKFMEFQSQAEAEKSWRDHLAQQREAAALSRTLANTLPNAQSAQRSEPRRLVLSTGNKTRVSYISTASASYTFEGRDYQAYDQQLQALLQSVRGLMGGRGDWLAYDQAQGDGGHIIRYTYRWQEGGMRTDFHELALAVNASAPSEWSPDFSILLSVTLTQVDSVTEGAYNWRRTAQSTEAATAPPATKQVASFLLNSINVQATPPAQSSAARRAQHTQAAAEMNPQRRIDRFHFQPWVPQVNLDRCSGSQSKSSCQGTVHFDDGARFEGMLQLYSHKGLNHLFMHKGKLTWAGGEVAEGVIRPDQPFKLEKSDFHFQSADIKQGDSPLYIRHQGAHWAPNLEAGGVFSNKALRLNPSIRGFAVLNGVTRFTTPQAESPSAGMIYDLLTRDSRVGSFLGLVSAEKRATGYRPDDRNTYAFSIDGPYKDAFLVRDQRGRILAIEHYIKGKQVAEFPLAGLKVCQGLKLGLVAPGPLGESGEWHAADCTAQGERSYLRLAVESLAAHRATLSLLQVQGTWQGKRFVPNKLSQLEIEEGLVSALRQVTGGWQRVGKTWQLAGDARCVYDVDSQDEYADRSEPAPCHFANGVQDDAAYRDRAQTAERGTQYWRKTYCTELYDLASKAYYRTLGSYRDYCQRDLAYFGRRINDWSKYYYSWLIGGSPEKDFKGQLACYDRKLNSATKARHGDGSLDEAEFALWAFNVRLEDDPGLAYCELGPVEERIAETQRMQQAMQAERDGFASTRDTYRRMGDQYRTAKANKQRQMSLNLNSYIVNRLSNIGNDARAAMNQATGWTRPWMAEALANDARQREAEVAAMQQRAQSWPQRAPEPPAQAISKPKYTPLGAGVNNKIVINGPGYACYDPENRNCKHGETIVPDGKGGWKTLDGKPVGPQDTQTTTAALDQKSAPTVPAVAPANGRPAGMEREGLPGSGRASPAGGATAPSAGGKVALAACWQNSAKLWLCDGPNQNLVTGYKTVEEAMKLVSCPGGGYVDTIVGSGGLSGKRIQIYRCGRNLASYDRDIRMKPDYGRLPY
ncbi:hypothetical protein [Sedimenticola selenatireducens]|uniref:Lysozyme inhibitor LprI N-terminal domain-containing protein n=1 Tax=Sedimenticola selenatireducens TaxID=191960 RepID=A0A557SH49_9GAMM|nr:hypothetical protein [Sedimenticola selenatireducens]TVO76749.1 hypothetical protein FHP88_04815 [Sedimenticola selenatireducens]TVT64192.1 MAG: hypothetical protein FHK78_08060 [Sedimenticola selenatireducens]